MTAEESGVVWRKSSFSSNGSDCVEIAVIGGNIAVRDSKRRSGPVLVFWRSEWEAFVNGARKGEFDV